MAKNQQDKARNEEAQRAKTKAIVLAKILIRAKEVLEPNRIKSLTDIRISRFDELVTILGGEVEKAYLNARLEKLINGSTLKGQNYEFFEKMKPFFDDVSLDNFDGREHEIIISYANWRKSYYPREKNKDWTTNNFKIRHFFDYCLKTPSVTTIPKLDGVISDEVPLANLNEKALNEVHRVITT